MWHGYSTKCSELPPRQHKLKSNDIVKEAASQWCELDDEAKAAVTDPVMEELMLAREEANMKPKITPIHVLNDMSATIAKIKCEVCPHNPADGHLVHIE